MPPTSAAFHAERNGKLADRNSKALYREIPPIIAGDLNATPWSMAFNDLTDRGTRRSTTLRPTWPTALGGWVGIPIDHVLVSHRWRRVDSWRGPNLASDHAPVLVRLALAPRSPTVVGRAQ